MCLISVPCFDVHSNCLFLFLFTFVVDCIEFTKSIMLCKVKSDHIIFTEFVAGNGNNEFLCIIYGCDTLYYTIPMKLFKDNFPSFVTHTNFVAAGKTERFLNSESTVLFKLKYLLQS